MKKLQVALGDRSYPIFIGQEILQKLAGTLNELDAKSVALISDTNVMPLYGDKVKEIIGQAGIDKLAVCVLPAGEENKRLSFIEDFCGSFLEAGLDRSSVVVALGGGVVGDMAGYTAASFMRGIRHVQIPTSIVAQVDSSVGGKTAVNHPRGKNIIGAFHQPSAVIADMTVLKTLPGRELRAGLAEAIKHGVIADEALFSYMEQNVNAILKKDLEALEVPIVRSCEIKSDIVAQDEREKGLRANLNYGHTFGHGIEAVTHYEKFLHGEAIALGMHAAGVLSKELGLVNEEFVERQRNCLATYGLPVSWPEMPVDETLELMKHDKKVQAGTMRFVVIDKLGHAVQRTDVDQGQARNALEALLQE